MTDQEILDIAHRTATVYRHRSDPDSPSYGFVNHTVIDFGRKVERAVRAELAKPRLDQAETNKRLQALADSEGTRAVEYLRRARKAESEIERLRAELAKPVEQQLPDWHDAPTCAGLWTCQHIDDFSATIFNDYEVANFVEPVELENCRWYGPIPQDKGKEKS